MDKKKVNILELFDEEKRNNSYLTVSAPMVRYSKLEFRTLLRKYKTKLCFTPMIIADSFCRSSNARNNEFTTNDQDSPLVAQFAAKNSIEFSTAAELIYPYVDGVDLNCGCPQNWAIGKGYGCALLKKPEIIHDVLRTVRRNLPEKFSCSIKIRLLNNNDIKKTIDLCRKLESCGATFLTIHGRTPWQKTSEPVDINLLTDIKKSINIPLILNGDIKTNFDANLMYMATKCDGIMVARGLLKNPTLFTNTDKTTNECLQDWINISSAANSNITYQCFHHHLTFMIEKLINKCTRKIFNNYTKKNEVYKFMEDYYDIKINNNSQFINNYNNKIICSYSDDLYIKRLKEIENYDKNYFNNKSDNETIFEDWNQNNVGQFYNNFTQFD